MGLGFHDLQHTHATLLLARGVPIRLVQERLGHANIAITLGVYSHVLPRCGGPLPQNSTRCSPVGSAGRGIA